MEYYCEALIAWASTYAGGRALLWLCRRRWRLSGRFWRWFDSTTLAVGGVTIILNVQEVRSFGAEQNARRYEAEYDFRRDLLTGGVKTLARYFGMFDAANFIHLNTNEKEAARHDLEAAQSLYSELANLLAADEDQGWKSIQAKISHVEGELDLVAREKAETLREAALVEDAYQEMRENELARQPNTVESLVLRFSAALLAIALAMALIRVQAADAQGAQS